MFIITVGVLFIAFIVLIIGLFGWKFSTSKEDKDTGKFLSLGSLAFVVLSTLGTFWIMFVTIVPENAVGVQVIFGKAQNTTLNSGLNIKSPLAKVHTFSFQTQKFEAPELSAASKDLQIVDASVTVNWQIQSNTVVNIFREFRGDIENRVLIPSIEESLKASTAAFNAEELVSQRPIVRDNFTLALREKLNRFETCPGCIRIIETNLGNFDFSDVFDAAVESKVEAEQQALQAENITKTVIEQARQAEERAKGERAASIEKAEGQKRSAILEAEGQAEAILAVAEAQANANNLIDASLTDEIIRWQLVNGIEITTAVLPSGSEFILGPEILGK